MSSIETQILPSTRIQFQRIFNLIMKLHPLPISDQFENRIPARDTHRQRHLLIVVLHVEGPPALDPLLFEDGHHRHRAVVLEQRQRAQFGGLGAAGEPVQVQRNLPQEVVRRKVVRIPYLTQRGMCKRQGYFVSI